MSSKKSNKSQNNVLPDVKQEVVSITYEEIGLFPRSFSRVLERFLKQVFSDVENLVIQEYRFYRYLFLTTLKCLFILFFVPFFVSFIAKTYAVRPLTEFFWNSKQHDIFLNSSQQKHAFSELKDFEEKLYFESLIYPFFKEDKIDISSSNSLYSLVNSTQNVGRVGLNGNNPLGSKADPTLETKEEPLGNNATPTRKTNLQSPLGAVLRNRRGDTGVGAGPVVNSAINGGGEVTPKDTTCPRCGPPTQSKVGLGSPPGDFLNEPQSSLNQKFLQKNGNDTNLTHPSETRGASLLVTRRTQEVNPEPRLPPPPDFSRVAPGGVLHPGQMGKQEKSPILSNKFSDSPLTSDEKTEYLINAYTLKSSLFVYQTIEADKNIQQRYQEKTIELAQRYNDQSIEAITNFFADLIGLFTLFYLLYALEIQINITKSFLLEVFFGLDDSQKSLLILLITDLLVGYHSSNLWELFFEFLFNHYGLPESQTGIFLLVATLPVLLDVLFKYLIFRHLNRSSPATVATYHAMIE